LNDSEVLQDSAIVRRWSRRWRGHKRDITRTWFSSCSVREPLAKPSFPGWQQADCSHGHGGVPSRQRLQAGVWRYRSFEFSMELYEGRKFRFAALEGWLREHASPLR